MEPKMACLFLVLVREYISYLPNHNRKKKGRKKTPEILGGKEVRKPTCFCFI